MDACSTRAATAEARTLAGARLAPRILTDGGASVDGGGGGGGGGGRGGGSGGGGGGRPAPNSNCFRVAAAPLTTRALRYDVSALWDGGSRHEGHRRSVGWLTMHAHVPT